MQTEIINNQNKVKFDLEFIGRSSACISNKFDPDNHRSLNIIFITNDEIQKFNKSYRNIDGPTDVLSFSYLLDIDDAGTGDGTAVIGEIYISPEEALKNSRNQGKDWSLELEIMMLVVHGMLHIYGYDHENEEERAVMYSIQDSMIHELRNKNWNSY
ncbi:MAG: rRNA maturation RNase YbeY [Actinomycetia bacterium]|nr:rRNA maturation RNase YbeY [Actinomycetes bacterium]